MTFKQKLLTPLAVLSVAVGAISTLGAWHARAADSPAVDVAKPVQATEALRVDASLYNTVNLDWDDAARSRLVPAKLYLPKTDTAKPAMAKLPLVIFSHGIGGSREGYSYLGSYFASQGFASLHVQHVGSDRQLWAGNPLTLVFRLTSAAQESEALARVKDVGFALDQLLASPYGKQIDASRITAAGHSYGANTTLLIAGAQVELQGRAVSLRDPRISSAIVISAPPFYGLGAPQKILSGIAIPTLHITATADDIEIPGYKSGVADRVALYQATAEGTQSRKMLAVFKEGSHSIFTDRMGTGGALLNPMVKVATRQLAVAFINSLQAPQARAEALMQVRELDQWRERYSDILATVEKAAM